jgi:hypothetical protein
MVTRLLCQGYIPLQLTDHWQRKDAIMSYIQGFLGMKKDYAD